MGGMKTSHASYSRDHINRSFSETGLSDSSDIYCILGGYSKFDTRVKLGHYHAFCLEKEQTFYICVCVFAGLMNVQSKIKNLIQN